MDVIEDLKSFWENTQKKNSGGRGRFGGGGGGGGGVGGQGGCERRIEVFVQIQKKIIFFFWGGGGGQVWGVRMDVNEELKFLVNFQRKKNWGGGGGVRGVGLGVQGGCE